MSKTESLVYVALGGAGEIGMNMYLYGYGAEKKRRWIMVDAGVAFPDMDSSPGVDLITADPEFITSKAHALDAIFITHAHEDHVGAIGRLFPQLKAPIYAREFTAEIARGKMEEAGQDPSEVVTVGAWPEQVEVGPFKVGFLPISHSVPESSAMIIDSPAGRVFHTGDWKRDPDPQVGEPFDPDAIAEVSKDGILALVCDSTNVFSKNPGRSEAELVGPVTELLKNQPGLVVATTFASNVARLRTLALAGQAAGRSIAVIGRAMHKMIGTARKTGLLTDFPDMIDINDAAQLPAENVLVLASGSQGEGRAASAQLSRGGYGKLSLKDGDTFLFSSKVIPGNEVAVARIENALAMQGVDVVGEEGGLYHVSGHANRPDLEEMHRLTKPQFVIPMHGEYRHLREHAKLAEQGGFSAVVAPNGTMIDLSGNQPKVAEMIDTGRRYVDGSVIYGAMDGIVRDRIRMAIRGFLVVNIVLDEKNRLVGDAWVEARGLFTEVGGVEAGLQSELEEVITRDLAKAKAKVRADDEAVEKLVKQTAINKANRLIGKKPEVTVMINRLED
ncbi:ribonuclease J [Pontivivens insulae]|uniref:Ribonuclease J1 n=1 Tax=Pontivivens insulae TaxID=1639689 RepID=A0A2R8ACF2_9RHOB|nr:ribonuclease J [Pontivivens insulae]RED13778.1 ribonuclease J [Pontivivens insulae]SPF29852.1 Ribonuclease J1 [Pontivivens insulae]